MSRIDDVTNIYLNSAISSMGLTKNTGTTGNAVFDNVLKKAQIQELLNKYKEKKQDETKESEATASAASPTTYGTSATGLSGISNASILAALTGSSTATETTTTMEQIFQEAAAQYGVSTKLLKAVAKQESGFNPQATSGAGAMGVMQLMPGTAASLGVTDAYDAKQNIMGGAKLLSQLLSKYNGDVSLALAAYNAGPGNVDKYGGVPPFTETQNYVRNITAMLNEAEPTVSTTVSGSSDDTAALNQLLGVLGGSTTSTDTLNLSADVIARFAELLRAQLLLNSTASIGKLDFDDD